MANAILTQWLYTIALVILWELIKLINKNIKK
jgi:hypothetical protein